MFSHESSAPEGKRLIVLSAQRRKTKGGWNGLLHKTLPLPAQIRALAQEDALSLLDFIQQNCLVRGTDVTRNISVWLWSLLARLDDVGSMDNSQVSQIRELGKKAILVQLSFTNPSAAEQVAQETAEDDVAESTAEPEIADDETSGMTEEYSAVTNAAENADDPATSRQNTMATLDTIIALVGDVFRQRDLLEFRQSWNGSMADLQEVEVQPVLP